VVVAEDDGHTSPDERRIIGLGEAKLSEELTLGHLTRLEQARTALGSRAVDAKLLLFGARVGDALRTHASRRSDVELVDLERLYFGD